MVAKKIRRPKAPRFDLDSVEPIRLTSKPAGDEDVEMIHVFSIDGTDYYMPTSVPFVHAVKSMDIAGSEGEAAAVRYQLKTMLGDEGYAALIGFEGIQEADFRAICDLANKIIMTSQEGKAP